MPSQEIFFSQPFLPVVIDDLDVFEHLSQFVRVLLPEVAHRLRAGREPRLLLRGEIQVIPPITQRWCYLTELQS